MTAAPTGIGAGLDTLALVGELLHGTTPIARLMRDHGAPQMGAAAKALRRRGGDGDPLGRALQALLRADRSADLGDDLADEIAAVEAARRAE